MPEAIVEHATLKDLIAQIEGKAPDGEMVDAKVKVLSEYAKHHVKEEQNEMFPKAKKTRLDSLALGAQLAARKKKLLAQRAWASQERARSAVSARYFETPRLTINFRYSSRACSSASSRRRRSQLRTCSSSASTRDDEGRC